MYVDADALVIGAGFFGCHVRPSDFGGLGWTT